MQEFGLTPRRYVLLVSRFVPEKRHLDLIQAFMAAALPDWKLVLVGKADKRDAYAASVQAATSNAENIVCTGFMRGKNLHEIYLHAGIFVLPSSHEGLPISVLEALSYGLPVIASDIPANREIHSEAIDYFPVGDISALTQILRKKVQIDFEPIRCEQIRSIIKTEYQWSDIAQKTHSVYQTVRL
jgi:glycosyltransferase involved in cell wall biosynthesis